MSQRTDTYAAKPIIKYSKASGFAGLGINLFLERKYSNEFP